MTCAIVRVVHSVKAIRQDDFKYHYTPMPIPYFTHVSEVIVVQQLKGNIFQSMLQKGFYS